MRTTMKALFAASAVCLVASCAATPTPSVVEPVYELDLQKMAVIEEIAETRGVRVIWVNAPRKPATL